MDIRGRMEAEHGVLARIARGAPLAEILGALALLVEQQAAGAICSILLVDAERHCLVGGAAPSLPAAFVEALEDLPIGPDIGTCGAAAYRRTPVATADIAKDPNWATAHDLAARHGLRACWSSPIISDEQEVVGTFAIYYREPRLPRDDERTWAEVATNLAAIAITRARMVEALERDAERLELMSELNEATATTSDPETLLRASLGIIGRRLGASRVAYAELEPENDRCRIVDDYTNGCASTVGEYRISQFSNRIIEAFKSGRPVVIDDVQVAYPEESESFAALDVRALVACVLFREGKPRATMALHDKSPRRWSRHELALVEEAVQRCWAAIEQRRAEQRLRENQDQLQLASSVAKVGGWTVDLASRRLFWSEQLFALHERPVGPSPKLRDALASCAPAYRELATKAFEACMRDGTPFDLVLQMDTAKGRRIWIRAIGRAERNETGAITRIHGALQDIDERRRLEDQLRQAQKMDAVGRLAGGVAHDFNNLLAVILSYSAFLIDELAPDNPVRADIEQIQGAGRRAADLTGQLLTFSRQQPSEPRPLDLETVALDLEKMLRRVVGPDVTLSIRRKGEVGRVLADKGQMEQVLMNLVVNARDAVKPGGNITVEITEALLDAEYAAEHHGVVPGRHVVIAVSDDGHGMDAETQARIFEPFFTTKESGKGTGLGLASVYGIVTQSGGHVWVYSEPGLGTTFKIFLPRTEAALKAPVVSLVPAASANRGTETILLVDDTEAVRTHASAMLRRAGYQVIEAADGEAAVAASERHSSAVDLLLTDVVLPGMSGRDLARRLGALRAGVKTLFISGYGRDAAVKHGLLDSGAAFLAKPLTPDVLLSRVRDVLGRATDTARHRERVLHVDDEESLLILVARVLGRLGYRTVSFPDPLEAVRAFETAPEDYDAVVTDVEMPQMNGFDLVRRLRAVRPALPVVVTSGAFRPHDVATAEALGLHSLVVKPNTVEELGRTLHEELRRGPASEK